MQRDHKISIRFNDQEYEKVRSKAKESETSLSNYIRRSSLRPSVPESDGFGIDDESRSNIMKSLIRLKAYTEKLSNGSKLKPYIETEVERIWQLVNY